MKTETYIVEDFELQGLELSNTDLVLDAEAAGLRVVDDAATDF